MAATIAPIVMGGGGVSLPCAAAVGAVGAGTVPTSGGPSPGCSSSAGLSCSRSVEAGGEAMGAPTRRAARARDESARRALMTIEPGSWRAVTSRAGSDPRRLHGANAEAGLLQVGHLLGVAEADQLPTVL